MYRTKTQTRSRVNRNFSSIMNSFANFNYSFFLIVLFTTLLTAPLLVSNQIIKHNKPKTVRLNQTSQFVYHEAPKQPQNFQSSQEGFIITYRPRAFLQSPTSQDAKTNTTEPITSPPILKQKLQLLETSPDIKDGSETRSDPAVSTQPRPEVVSEDDLVSAPFERPTFDPSLSQDKQAPYTLSASASTSASTNPSSFETTISESPKHVPPSTTTMHPPDDAVSKPNNETSKAIASNPNTYITATQSQQQAPKVSTVVPSTAVPSTPNQTQVSPLLIYSIRYEIRSFDISNGVKEGNFSIDHARFVSSKSGRTLIGGLKNTIGLDFYYSPSESYIFWADVMDERIFRGTISNGMITNVNMIVQGGLSSAEGLAVDWVAKNIYWVESTLDHIEVANMNGSYRRTLIAGDMESPRAISLDPRYGLLFWTDWDKRSPRIERATMSGEERTKIVDIKEVNGGWPNGLTLDYEALKIYWIDANSDSIHVVDYQGRNHRSLLRKIKSLGHPFAITLYDNNLYWTDWKTNFISTASKLDGSEAKEVQRLQSRVFDIKVFHPNRQPKVDIDLNPCGLNNGNCSHLCLLSVNITRTCACPHLMRLTKDKLTCEIYERVLLIGKTNEIRAVDVAKPMYHIMSPIIVPKVSSPRQFDFDAKSRSIFWVDSITNEVKRAQLAGTSIETIIDQIIEAPSGLALDWITGNIYVSSSPVTKPGKIFISNLNGEFISILMDHRQGIISPKSIVVHPLLGLLFCIDENEVSGPLIFMATMDGQSKRSIITSNFNKRLNPTSLSIDFESCRVYWINQISGPQDASIQYYDIIENRVVTLYNETKQSPDQKINPNVLCIDGDHLVISTSAFSDYIIRASKDNIANRTIHKIQNLDNLMALRVYNASSQFGSNACSIDNGGCSQLCIPTEPGNRTCKCTLSYTVNPNNSTECLGRDEFLIFSYNHGMRGISLEPHSSVDDYYLPPIHRASRALSVDYIYRENLIYWVDNEDGSITRINRDTTSHQVIIQGLESEEYIGIDWVARNIYWLDPYYDIIEVARLDGANRYVIISGDMDKANGIVVNGLKGYIVWSDIGSLPKIERARLDGSNRTIIVNTEIGHVDDLAIDCLEDYIYWIDSTLSIIERVRADGSKRQIVFKGQTNSQDTQHHLISMAIHKDYLYIADAFNDGSVIRLHKGRSNDSVEIIQQNLSDSIRDIAIFAPQPLPNPEDNPCVVENGGCQDLCLFLGEKGKKRCVCTHGKLKTDGLTCRPYDTFMMFSKQSQIDSLHIQDDESPNNSPYPPVIIESKSNVISLTIDYSAQRVIYSEMTQEQICSVSFNGSDKRVLVEKQSMVEGIAFNNNQLYWTNIQDNSISRLNTTSSGNITKNCNNTDCVQASIEKLVKLGPEDRPRGIAIDTCSSYVYWTNWNTQASIQRASPSNGYKIESIIKTDIKVPNGIAIDQKRRKLYWCDARLDKIETCDMDGTNRLVLISAMPQHPFALAVWKSYIFWTDWLAKGVFKANKYTGQQAQQIKKVLLRPMGIVVASPDTFTCPVDACGTNNGGCPAGYTCISRETENDQSQISCHSNDQIPLRRFKPTYSSKTICSNNDNGTKCNEYNTYHAIISNHFERFGLSNQSLLQQAVLTPSSSLNDLSSTDTTDGPKVSTVVSLTTTDSSSVINPSPFVSPSSITMKSSVLQIKSNYPSNSTDSNTSVNSSKAPPSPIPPPCQIAPVSLPTTSTGLSVNNYLDCKVPNQFKCYLSENLMCISNEKRCDGSHDCPSREDESDCVLSSRGQYNVKQENNWYKFVTVILVILGAALAALFLVFGHRGRRRWFVGSHNGFNHSKMFEDNGTNIEISNPMFDEDDSANLVHCAFSIDLNERTTNFSNPLYERQVLLVNDKTPTS